MQYQNLYWIEKIKENSEETNELHFQLSEFAKDLGLYIHSNQPLSNGKLISFLESLFHQQGNIGPITFRRFVEIIEKLLQDRAKAHAVAKYVIDDTSEVDDLDLVCMGRTYIAAFQILIASEITESSRKMVEQLLATGDDNLWKAYPDFINFWRTHEETEFKGDGLDQFWWSNPASFDFTKPRPRFDEFGNIVQGADEVLR